MNACERKSYVFLRKELPVRLANIMKEIALLPDSLLRTPSVGLVSNWYAKSFEEVLEFERSEPTSDTLEKFCSTLIHIRDRHSETVQTMASGIIELKETQNIEPGMETSIQYFLDRFYMSRISIRMLINQHSEIFCTHKKYRIKNTFFQKPLAILFGEMPNKSLKNIGCIEVDCDPKGKEKLIFKYPCNIFNMIIILCSDRS